MKTVKVVLIIMTVSCLVLMLACSASEEEQAANQARIAKINSQLETLQPGDFLEFEEGYFGIVTRVIGDDACRFATMLHGQSGRYDFNSIAPFLKAVHKRSDPDWPQLAIDYCTPPYSR